MQGGVRRDGQRGMKITWGGQTKTEQGEMGVRDVRAASRATEAERDAGVNDVRIVQRARVRPRSPLPSLHMLAPAAQPTLDKKNTPCTPRLLQWNNLPAQGNLHWSWADPRL